MQTAITAVFNWLTGIGTAVGIIVATAFAIWGGYLYMSAEGNVRRMERAKQSLINAGIGLAIVIIANTVATELHNILT